jgi:hypothetical protein
LWLKHRPCSSDFIGGIRHGWPLFEIGHGMVQIVRAVLSERQEQCEESDPRRERVAWETRGGEGRALWLLDSLATLGGPPGRDLGVSVDGCSPEHAVALTLRRASRALRSSPSPNRCSRAPSSAA